MVACSKVTAKPAPNAAPSTNALVKVTPLDTSWHGDPGKLLAVGEEAPNFEGLAHTGMRVRLSAFLERPVVVYFDAADLSPIGTATARAFRDGWLRIDHRVGMVFGVSPDDRVADKDFATGERLPFLLIADVDGGIARAFGLKYGSDRDKAIVFIVGKDGKIARVLTDSTPDRVVEETLAVLGG